MSPESSFSDLKRILEDAFPRQYGAMRSQWYKYVLRRMAGKRGSAFSASEGPK